jgi:hypothetical protein
MRPRPYGASHTSPVIRSGRAGPAADGGGSYTRLVATPVCLVLPWPAGAAGGEPV